MAVDKNKIIAEATKLVQKGSLDKAIATYQKILNEDPKDVRVLLKVGELYQKKGDDKLAADAFTRVAETYAEQGFFLKSVAVYKQIVKLDPESIRVNERLAALYQQLGLLSDAMSQLQFMAAAHEKAGDTARLTEVLQRMVELDPDNIASSIKLGELHARANQPGPALECFQRAAAYLKKHSRADEYVKVAERISSLQPHDVGLTRELANIYLAKGDTKRALAKLQLCFKADPKDVDTLHLLAQAFRDLGQTSKTISVYKELAHVHEEHGRHADARATWRKVQELAPEDEDAAAALGAARGGAGPPQPPPPPSPAPPAARPAVAAPPPVPPPGASRQGGPVAPPPGAEAIPKLLTETDVYVKYGLHDKALDHLRKVLALDPKSPEAHERAREIHLAAGRRAEAGDAGAAAVRALLARGQQDRARAAVARLREIDPGNPQLQELAAGAGCTDEVYLGTAELEELAEAPEVVLDPEAAHAAETDEDALALAAAGAEGEEVVEDEPAPPPPEEGVTLEVVEPDLDAAGDALAEAAAGASAQSEEVYEDEPLPAPEVEAEAEPAVLVTPPPPSRGAVTPPPAPVLVIPPPPAPAAARTQPRAAARPAPAAVKPAPAVVVAAPPPPVAAAPPAPARQAAKPPPSAPRKEPARAAAAPPPPAEDEQADLSDEIEEADFFVQQGLFDEARDALRNLLAFYPGHRGVEEKLAEVERRAAPTPAAKGSPAPVASAEGLDESFDIARELAEELGDAAAAPAPEEEFQYSVEDVFSQFKKGVEATVKPEDSATHYDLGIAYKEMGLLDDALHEFEIALKGNDRKKEVDCLSMIGLCQMARGAAREAIRAYRRALGSDFLTRESAKAIHYDLGAAYEAAGEGEVALFYLQKVAKIDPSFRDVAKRVAALGGGPGRPPPESEARGAARPANGAAAPGRASASPRSSGPAAPGAPAAGAKKNIGYL
jgi:tetratricopeptide (TPR) repeat protein